MVRISCILMSRHQHEQHRFSNQTLTVRELNYEVEQGPGLWERIKHCELRAEGSRRRILHQVNLEVRSGEMLAVLGGSGKPPWIPVSTLGTSCHHGYQLPP